MRSNTQTEDGGARRAERDASSVRVKGVTARQLRALAKKMAMPALLPLAARMAQHRTQEHELVFQFVRTADADDAALGFDAGIRLLKALET